MTTAPEATTAGRSPAPPSEQPEVVSGSRAWRRLRRDPGFWAGALISAFLTFIAIWPGSIAGIFGADTDPNACDLQLSRAAPEAHHPFGFTVQGCDLYVHVVYGAQNSVTIGLLTAVLTGLIGVVVGLVSGYFGGVVDVISSRATEIVFAVPGILGAILILSMFEQRSAVTLSVTLALLGWPLLARVVRANVLSLKTRRFVTASRLLDVSHGRILFAHILPNTLGPVLVIVTTTIGGIIGAEAALSYLGIGLQLPAISWGLQLSTAQKYFEGHLHLLVYPVLALLVAVVGFILLGDALRRAFGVERDAI